MYIDKTHSKRDIINVFKKLGVDLNFEYSKAEIIMKIPSIIDNCIFNDKIKNLTELNEYLSRPSNKQRPNVNQKNKIMFLSKKIIKWSKNNYILNGTYENGEDALADVMQIYKWGDISAVRKACKAFNYNPYINAHINPIVSDEILNEIQNNKMIKNQYINSLIIRRAKPGEKILVTFD